MKSKSYISYKYVITLLIASLVIIMGTSLKVANPVPPGAISPYLNGALPSTTPGIEGSWALKEAFPNIHIPAPVGIIEWPDGQSMLILSKRGEVHKVAADGSSHQLVLDISSNTFNLSDAGALGIILHPRFDDPMSPGYHHMYIYYKTKPNASQWDTKGFSILSRFTWDETEQVFDPNSEYILIKQYDRYPWHNGGPMIFDEEGYLYFSVGDEGAEEFQQASTQRLDGGFFNGVFRIDVDNDPNRSHPIRRQPQSNAAPPEGWGETYSQGYSIPNDNPWQDDNGNVLEEYYAIGLRSPFSMQFDELTKEIWITDTGSDVREEINKVQKADNLQWPYLEGTEPSENNTKPNPLIGNEKPPYLEYERDYGQCIVGGVLYRGSKFPSLYDHYVYGDFVSNKIAIVNNVQFASEIENQVILSNIGSEPVELPEKYGITGIFTIGEGRLLVTVMGEDHENDGAILELERNVVVDDPSLLLSELGIFSDIESLTPKEGFIPYDVNTPLWSDGAIKRRWIAVPNDGIYDTPNEKITFSRHDEWKFPPGTVFVKHFEMPLTDDPEGPIKRLETRLFVITEDDKPYGLTYRWNEEGTDATLLRIGESEDIDIYIDDEYSHTITWDYPSRSQCITCHNRNAGSILGVKTTQLNKPYTYGAMSINQLDYLNELNIFTQPISSSSSYTKLSPLHDDQVSLEKKIRSYLDANCSSCHREGGLLNVYLDFTYESTNTIQKILNLASQSHASTPNSVIVSPGDHSSSELWVRDVSLGSDRMPPLGRNTIDQIYVDSLAKWIDMIDIDQYTYHDLLVYPNPATEWITIHAVDEWLPPFEYSLYSASGRPIRFINSDAKTMLIDVSTYPAGAYVVTVTSGDRRRTKKIIIQ